MPNKFRKLILLTHSHAALLDLSYDSAGLYKRHQREEEDTEEQLEFNTQCPT